MTDQVYVTPGAGVKVPLPIPGGPSVPGVGCMVMRTFAVERLLRSGDLVEGAPAGAAPAGAAPAGAAPPAAVVPAPIPAKPTKAEA